MGFSLIRFWQSEDFLAMFLTSTPKKAVLLQTNSIECLICTEFLETSNRIAIFGHSQWDLRGTLCEVLGGELQTSIEDLQYVCKRKCYPKLKKIEKMMSNLKSLEEELRGSPAKSGPVHFASEKSFPLYFVHLKGLVCK